MYSFRTPLIWEIGYKGSGLIFTVPADAPFDVSVPWYLRWLASPHDKRYHKAASLHDEMLRQGWSRVEAAGPFERALAADGVGTFRRLGMFIIVAIYRSWRDGTNR